MCFVVGFVPAARADEGVVFVRDAEIEAYVHALAAPIYRAADIDPQSVTIALIQSNEINAFVAEGLNEFFYTGLLEKTKTPEDLAGIIAHETGHIAGGHLIRGKEEMKNASAEAIFATLLAVAAGAVSGNTNLALGGIAGGAQVAERSFLSFSRAQEASADSAALRFLDTAGISAKGMEAFLKQLAGQELLPQDRRDAYVRTHPLTQDRIDVVRRHVEASPIRDKKMAAPFYKMHERMKAKLLGFLHPQVALLRTTDQDPDPSRRYARAIALYKTGKADRALRLIDGLIKEEPDNPFFYELKGQVSFDNGRMDEALRAYEKAVKLLPSSALLQQALGHVLLESADKAHEKDRVDKALVSLIEAARLEPHEPMTWRFLASAWGRKAAWAVDNDYQALATYALAEEAAAQGNAKTAGRLASRAMEGLRRGSPYWLRAQDLKLVSDRMGKESE